MVHQAIELNRLNVLQWLHNQGKLALYLLLYCLKVHSGFLVDYTRSCTGCTNTLGYTRLLRKGRVFRVCEVGSCVSRKARDRWTMACAFLRDSLRDMELLQGIYEHHPVLQSTCADVRDAIHNGHLHVAKGLYARRLSRFFSMMIPRKDDGFWT